MDRDIGHINMTGYQLPNMLKNMIETLLAENQVTSWNIRGGTEFVQLSIRFTTDMAAKEDITYRKVPPSRRLRETRRQHKWKSGQSETNNNGNDKTPGDVNSIKQQFEKKMVDQGSNSIQAQHESQVLDGVNTETLALGSGISGGWDNNGGGGVSGESFC